MSAEPESGEYAAMQAELFGVRRAGIALELTRVEQALAALGQPQKRLPVCVHIAGTNGKGSTCAFVEAIAQAAGLRPAVFTSPHLSQFAERFRIAGQPASESDILAAYRRVQAIVDGVESERAMTFFERVFVMAVSLFGDFGLGRDAGDAIDLVILEVGLGGRYDATNVIDADVACVTGVALDHQDYLGDDLRDIAAAKAGIFKPGRRAVIGRSGEIEAVPWLIEHARRADVAGVRVVDGPVPDDWPLGLAGRHQRDNAACALGIVAELQDLGALPDLPARELQRAIRAGLARAVHPGRLEVLAERPRIVVDGAHNPHGAHALAAAAATWPNPRALVLGVSADKDAAAIATALQPAFSGPRDALVLTRAANLRAMALSDLRAAVLPVWKRTDAVHQAESPDAALAHARARVGTDGVVAVAGSLFLVGEVRELFA